MPRAAAPYRYRSYRRFDPVENARIIIGELEKYSEKLANKPRWLVFNKIDLMDKAEAEAKAKAIAEAMGWEDKYYLISAASQVGVKDLCWDVMTFIIENPIVQAEEAKQPEKVEFMWMTTTVSSSKSWKRKKMMKTGTMTGMKTTKKASSSSTSTNICPKPPLWGLFLFQRCGQPAAGDQTTFSAILKRQPAVVELHDALHDTQAQTAATVALVKTAEWLGN